MHAPQAKTLAVRRVVHADALVWLSENPATAGTSVITSLPDLSELPHLDLAGWRDWFRDTVRRVADWTNEVAIFYQSDVREGGAWIDKGHLVIAGAEAANATVLWHKIVCRRPPGTIAFGRPSYSHMIAIAKTARVIRKPGPDVLDAGHMPWSRAMGINACRVACRFLRDESNTRTVVDPFCGRGTVLAVANAMGFDAIGIDISGKRCRAARAFVVGDGPGVATLADAAELFDRGAYWEAHEAWERLWRLATDERARTRLQGLIQIAAGLHHLAVLEQPEPAARCLARGLAKLHDTPDSSAWREFSTAITALLGHARAGHTNVTERPVLGDRWHLLQLATVVSSGD